MAKHKSKKIGDATASGTVEQTNPESVAVALDPTLNALFQVSLASSEKVPDQNYEPVVKPKKRKINADSVSPVPPNPLDDSHNGDVTMGDQASPSGAPETKKKRKRKRRAEPDDIEGKYMKRLELEQLKTDAKKRKRATEVVGENVSNPSDNENDPAEDLVEHLAAEEADVDAETFTIPQHESVAGATRGSELEKADRTVFLSNVASAAITSKVAKRQLLNHLSSFLDEMKDQPKPAKVESLRFRSVAFASNAIPKKAAFAKKEVMDATTKSTNAYVVYSTTQAARQAVKKLNATVVLDRHIRVDSVAHPAQVDNRRCVFVGNLGFVDDESLMRAAENGDEPKAAKSRPSGDVEEGLWRQFMKAGRVESVRVVRDKATRVGKGFAYVQFENANSVERALAFNEKRFPPLLPRLLRVTRAKNIAKTASRLQKDKPIESRPGAIYNPKQSPTDATDKGRARKLLGQSGAVAFEGHRAKRGSGSTFGKMQGKKKGKPQTRSSRRGAAFKAAKRGSK